jgi:hypothetical protein
MLHHLQTADTVSRTKFHTLLSINIHEEGITSASFCGDKA